MDERQNNNEAPDESGAGWMAVCSGSWGGWQGAVPLPLQKRFALRETYVQIDLMQDIPLKKLSHQQAGLLGEALALAKLVSLGLQAYVSPEGAPGHDLIVVANGLPKSIEVKTRQFLRRPTEFTRWPVDMKRKGDADFFLFVELALATLSPTFYFLTNAQARSVHKDYSGSGNCLPRLVRELIEPNNFDALSPIT